MRNTLRKTMEAYGVPFNGETIADLHEEAGNPIPQLQEDIVAVTEEIATMNALTDDIVETIEDDVTLSSIEEKLFNGPNAVPVEAIENYRAITNHILRKMDHQGVEPFPALEHFQNRYEQAQCYQISQEMLGTILKDIGRMIWAAIEALIKFLKSLWDKYFSASARLRYANKYAESKMKDADRAPAEQTYRNDEVFQGFLIEKSFHVDNVSAILANQIEFTNRAELFTKNLAIIVEKIIAMYNSMINHARSDGEYVSRRMHDPDFDLEAFDQELIDNARVIDASQGVIDGAQYKSIVTLVCELLDMSPLSNGDQPGLIAKSRRSYFGNKTMVLKQEKTERGMLLRVEQEPRAQIPSEEIPILTKTQAGAILANVEQLGRMDDVMKKIMSITNRELNNMKEIVNREYAHDPTISKMRPSQRERLAKRVGALHDTVYNIVTIIPQVFQLVVNNNIRAGTLASAYVIESMDKYN